MSERILRRFLEKQLMTLEEEWAKDKEQEIVTLHNAIADVVKDLKPHPSTLLTVLRIIEHETISDALKKIESGQPPEEVLKQRVKRSQ
jgi:hypothetical protein